MIGWWILAASLQPAAQMEGCRGVAITTPSGAANFIGLTAEGSDEALHRIRAEAEALHFNVAGPSVGIRGRVRVVVSFQTVRNHPEESTNGREAQLFLERAQRGEFGELLIRPLIMSMDTLPRDRC